MYNNIGLLTPRGSGTSGHVTRNLSHLRPREEFRNMNDRDMTIRHREPDAGILDHERKRKIEAKCFELQVELEDKETAEEEIERQVDELRQRLLAQDRTGTSGPSTERGALKEYQTHELLAAKAVDNARFERAFGIPRDYVEGESMNKEKQEERRHQRQAEKERRTEDLAERKRKWEAGEEERKLHETKIRAERAAAMEAHRIEVESRARDRESRMRDTQTGRERDSGRSAPRARNDLVDSYRPGARDEPRRSRSPRRRSRSPSPRRPVSRRDKSYSRSPSRSRSRSRSFSRSRSESRSRSRSPPRRRVSRGRRASTRSRSASSRSPSPPPRAARGRERSRSASLDRSRSQKRESRSPPRRRSPSPEVKSKNIAPASRSRRASSSGSEDMDVQSD